MAGSVQVTKNLGNGYVQVDAKTKKTVPKSYKVAETSADAFCKEYQANDIKMKKKANFIDFCLTPIVIFASYFGLDKLGAGKFSKLALGILATIGTMYGGNYVNINKYIKQKQHIIQKYNAIEIDQEASKKEDIFDKTLNKK